jgi:hypothetical protein
MVLSLLLDQPSAFQQPGPPQEQACPLHFAISLISVDVYLDRWLRTRISNLALDRDPVPLQLSLGRQLNVLVAHLSLIQNRTELSRCFLAVPRPSAISSRKFMKRGQPSL